MHRHALVDRVVLDQQQAVPWRRRQVGAAPALSLDRPSQQRFDALKAWRFAIAQAHNLPAYVIFHDATLSAIAQRAPRSLEELQDISGIGSKKLQAYGDEVLRVVQGSI